jgi:hypothetical protein
MSGSGGSPPFWGTSGGAGTVASVSNSDGTLVVSPTTGAVVASINLAHGNTWTCHQTIFQASGTDTRVTIKAGSSQSEPHFECLWSNGNQIFSVRTDTAYGYAAITDLGSGTDVIYLKARDATYGPLIQFPQGAGGFDFFNYRALVAVAGDQLKLTMGNSGATRLLINSDTSSLFDFLTSRIRVQPGQASDTPMILKGYTSQTAPLLQLRGISSTSTDRPLADVDAVFAVSTDASYKGRGVLRAWDFNATTRECVRWESTGTAAAVGFLGATASAQLTSPDVGTALVTFGFASGTPTFASANLTGNINATTIGATTPLQIQGYRPINTQTGISYTLVLGDSGQMVTLNNASSITLTVPTNASVAFPVGTEVDLTQLGAGQVSVAGSGGVTIDSYSGYLKIAGQYAGATLKKIATDTWILVGNLSA